jgi:site-specific DNA recombinase
MLFTPLVDRPELFAQVQDILDDRDRHALRQRKHQHHLRGLLTCARCGSRLLYTAVRGQAGGRFAYYVCGKRHRGDGCNLPYILAADIELRLERNWPMYVRLDLATPRRSAINCASA